MKIARRTFAAWIGSALVFGAIGCRRGNAGTTPEGAVREMIERLRRADGDPAEAKAAYELLSEAGKANLKARAERYSAASGKTISPEAMIAPASFLLRFEPQRFKAEIAGPHARVEVLGLLPEERASVFCVFDGEGWKVELPLPPPPQIQTRPFSD